MPIVHDPKTGQFSASPGSTSPGSTSPGSTSLGGHKTTTSAGKAWSNTSRVVAAKKQKR